MRIRIKDTSIIIISAELMMYGCITIRIDRVDDGITAAWLAVADGGDVVDNGEKTYTSVVFDDLLNQIKEIDFPDEENDEESISWGMQFGNTEGKLIEPIESGNWNRSALQTVIECIEAKVGDDESIASLKEMLEW